MSAYFAIVGSCPINSNSFSVFTSTPHISAAQNTPNMKPKHYTRHCYSTFSARTTKVGHGLDWIGFIHGLDWIIAICC